MKKLITIAIMCIFTTSCNNINENIATKINIENEVEEIDQRNFLDDTYNDNRREKITNRIKKLKYIDDVSVVVTEQFAVIGLKLNKEMEDSEIILIKNQIKSITKNIDKNIKYVSITTTPTLVEKIDNSISIPNEKVDIKLSEELEETITELTPQL